MNASVSTETAFFDNLANEVITGDDDAKITASIAFAVWWDTLPHARRCAIMTDHAHDCFTAGFAAGALKLKSEGTAQ